MPGWIEARTIVCSCCGVMLFFCILIHPCLSRHLQTPTTRRYHREEHVTTVLLVHTVLITVKPTTVLIFNVQVRQGVQSEAHPTPDHCNYDEHLPTLDKRFSVPQPDYRQVHDPLAFATG